MKRRKLVVVFHFAVDANGATVPASLATFTALGAFIDTRTASTDSAGKITFDRASAGDFTASTRDAASGLVGTALGLLPVGDVIPITRKLQPGCRAPSPACGGGGSLWLVERMALVSRNFSARPQTT